MMLSGLIAGALCTSYGFIGCSEVISTSIYYTRAQNELVRIEEVIKEHKYNYVLVTAAGLRAIKTRTIRLNFTSSPVSDRIVINVGRTTQALSIEWRL